MLVPRQQYSRELKVATMREIDSGKTMAEVARMYQISRRVARERRAGFPWYRHPPTTHGGRGADCSVRAEDRAGDDGE